jgi:hypothetical protein
MMKSSRLSFFAAFVLLVFVTCLGLSVRAATKAPPPPPDMRKMIKSVDAPASTVIIVYMHDRSTHTYKVDGLTVLKVNNQDGKIADVKPGMVVDDYAERDFDTLDSLSLSGYGTPPAVKPKAPAKPKPKPAAPPAPTQ